MGVGTIKVHHNPNNIIGIDIIMINILGINLNFDKI